MFCGWSAVKHGSGSFCIFTARIRRMGEGTVFSLFVSPHLDGEGGGWVSHPRSRWGGTPSWV